MSYKNYCQLIVKEALEKISPDKMVSGHDLGLKIEHDMIIPEAIDDLIMEMWAKELDEYYRYAIEEFGTVANPFSDRTGFFRECVGFSIRVLVGQSETLLNHWNEPFNAYLYKDQIIDEIYNVKELILQEVA